MTDVIRLVEALTKSASEAKDSGDAMRFSQAAVNVANALCSIESAKLMRGQKPKKR